MPGLQVGSFNQGKARQVGMGWDGWEEDGMNGMDGQTASDTFLEESCRG